MLSPEISLTNNEIGFVGFNRSPEHIGMILKNRCKGKTIMVLINDPGFLPRFFAFQRHKHDLLRALDLNLKVPTQRRCGCISA